MQDFVSVHSGAWWDDVISVPLCTHTPQTHTLYAQKLAQVAGTLLRHIVICLIYTVRRSQKRG